MITFDDSKGRPAPAITIADESAPAMLKVVGVGGGGCNAVNRMIAAGIKGVEFIAVNTDGQALRASRAGMRLQLITPNGRGKALGAGCDPDAAHKAALDRTDELIECLEGADMVFIAAGMGGGTGTGAAPVVGSLAREAGALTVAVVTKPFNFEGSRKARIAEKGIEELRKCVDTLITVPNSRLLQMVGPQVSVEQAFQLADEALRHGVQGISDIINETGVINRDFADVETVMRGGGMALMGVGTGAGEHRAIEAAQQAFSSPLLEETSLEGAQRVLVNFVGGPETTISEINDAAEYIAKRCSPDCLFLFGYGQRDELANAIQVTVIATGFGATAVEQPARPVTDRIAIKEPARTEKAAEPGNPFLPANLPSDYGVNVGNFSEFDTPTYLRRQMD
ncbi:MAG TPA: cell division protein FtsZ [Solirubrobacteraceae bacterium]|nr:cell division protein FtsZ [Solirubrobacteraceae bacterium]